MLGCQELLTTYTQAVTKTTEPIYTVHVQIHDQGRGVKSCAGNREETAGRPNTLRSHFVKTVSRTNKARQKRCHQPPRSIRECRATKRPTGQAHHRSSLELSSTHLKISSVNSIQSINNREVDDNTLFRRRTSVHWCQQQRVAHLTILRTVEVTISDRPRQLPHVNSHSSRRDPKLL